MIFCTLFDSNYLDKGIVLYKSLRKVCRHFKIYVLAMDKKCEDILLDYGFSEMTVIGIDPFSEKMGLVEVRAKRARGEFCWTCTSFLIDYVLTEYKEDICTYIDSDLFFYSDPAVLLEEMGDKTVQIIEHRFDNSIEGRAQLEISGKYCVEFDTFKNKNSALKLLRWWEKKCMESCVANDDTSKVFGDQKYQKNWGKLNFVNVIHHIGAGIAPWNISQYRLDKRLSQNEIVVHLKKRGCSNKVVFYHFHMIEYISKEKANIFLYHRGWNIDDDLVRALYIPYLKKLKCQQEEIDTKYGIYPIIYVHPAFESQRRIKKDVSYYFRKIKCWGIRRTMVNIYLKIVHFIRTKMNGEKDFISL